MMLRDFKRFRFWSVLVALLVAAQIGIALHVVEHKFTGDAAAAQEHCTLCKVTTAMAAAPAAPAIAPAEYSIGIADTCVAALLFTAAPTAAFRSRAPPTAVSA